jgi:hypothetical protein
MLNLEDLEDGKSSILELETISAGIGNFWS